MAVSARGALVVIDTLASCGGIYFASFLIAVVSGVLPVVNAELYLIGIVLGVVNGGWLDTVLLAVVIAAGQMLGKGLLFQTARGATLLGETRRPELAAKLERARHKVERWRSKPYSVLFVSAAAGLPPLYVVTLLAGILNIRFRAFLLVGFAGRSLRFGTIGVLAAFA